MSLPLVKVRLSGMAFSLAVVCLFCGSVLADPPDGAARIDGLAALAGGRASDESDSLPVLLSDVDFETALLALRKGWVETDADAWKKARRSAVLTKMLARNAKQLGETADSESIEAVVNEMTALAGGAEAMKALCARYGADSSDLRVWARNAILAARQLKYLREQVDIPSDTEITERLEQSAQGEAKNDANYELFRRRILDERFEAYVAAWLEDLLVKGRVRIMK